MKGPYLSKAEIMILKEISFKIMTVSDLAERVGRPVPTISKSVSHLSEIGLVSEERKGISKYIKMSEEEVGQRFKAFVCGNTNIDPVEIFHGHGLWIFTFLTGEGASTRSLLNITGLSRGTIISYQNNWKRSGVIWKEGHGGKYSINRNFPDLESFLVSFSKHLLSDMIMKGMKDPLILFNDGKVIIFSCEGSIDSRKFEPAAYSHLARNGFDVVTTDDYYMFRFGNEPLNDLEALIQAIRIDPLNPRPRKLLRKMIIEGNIESVELLEVSRRYCISDLIANEVRKIEGK